MHIKVVYIWTLMSSICYAEFDAERRAFSKLELKRVRQQQATDRVDSELATKLETRQASLAGKLS